MNASPLSDPAIALAPENLRQPSRGRFDSFFCPFRLQEMEELMHQGVQSLALALPWVDLDDPDALVGKSEGLLPTQLALDDADAHRNDIAISHGLGSDTSQEA